MTTNVRVFCDTNVVIRLNVAETPEHERVTILTLEAILSQE